MLFAATFAESPAGTATPILPMTTRSSNSECGWVISDLHLFAQRSEGAERMNHLLPMLRGIDRLVLNGDIFDFRWSMFASHAESVARAVAWLKRLHSQLPDTQIHYVLGNHDCLEEFVVGLAAASAAWDRFQIHHHTLLLRDRLFLHGDCTNARMDQPALDRYRRQWSRDRQRHGIATTGYQLADRVGLTHLVHRWQFPKQRTLDRLRFHLDQLGITRSVVHCYFGHTHGPFNDVEHAGIRFHNTGSAIAGMGFNPVQFELPA